MQIGPINYLICLDQIIRVFSILNILRKMAALMLDQSLETILGGTFCWWFDFFGQVDITGATIWSAYIALYRVLYIKAQVKYSHQSPPPTSIAVKLNPQPPATPTST